MKIVYPLLLALTVLSCKEQGAQKQKVSKSIASTPEISVEAISFSGDTLYQRKTDSLKLAKHLGAIGKIEAKQTLTEQDYISIGENYAAVFQYNNAIKTYTEGLNNHQHSYKLLRHKAHRLLATRKVDQAMADLDIAKKLIAESDDKGMEYYANGKKKGTYEYWIYYHLGIGHFLKRDFDEATKAFTHCMETAITAKNRVGATDWLYHCHQRANRPERAQQVLDALTFEEGMDLKYPYVQRVMLYKGETTPEKLLDPNKPATEWNGAEMTIAYGLASWYLYHGDQKRYQDLIDKVLKMPFWNAWAYLLADKEAEERAIAKEL